MKLKQRPQAPGGAGTTDATTGRTIVAVASVFLAATVMTTPEPSHAFGWSDIKGAAKKVGKAAKKAGKAVGREVKDVATSAGAGAKDIAKGAGRAAKEVGALGYTAAKGIVTTAPIAGVSAVTDIVVRPALRVQQRVHGALPGRNQAEIKKEYDKALSEAHKTFQSGGRYLDRGVNYVEDKIKNNTGRGTLTSRNPRREYVGSVESHLRKTRKTRRVRSRVVKGSNRALPPARSLRAAKVEIKPKLTGKPKTARGVTRRSTNKPGQWGGQTTAKLPPASRPARKLPPSRNQRPRPITANDVKPPFCNSKFENCSGKHKQKHRGKKYNGRDRSTWGRPVSKPRKKPRRSSSRSRSAANWVIESRYSRTQKARSVRAARTARKLPRSRGRSRGGHGSYPCYGNNCSAKWLPNRKSTGNLRKGVRSRKIVRENIRRKPARRASIDVRRRTRDRRR